MTRVVLKWELGRPVERLKEQMKKLQLHSSQRTESKAGMSDQQLAMTEETVRSLEAEKQAAETRAKQAERKVSTREKQVARGRETDQNSE